MTPNRKIEDWTAVCPRCNKTVIGRQFVCPNCHKTQVFVEDIVQDFSSAGTVTSRFVKCACGNYPSIKCSCGAIINNESILPPIVERKGPQKLCFVATACYGADHVYVEKLRDFRDNRLMRHAFGRLIVSLYNIIGPPMATFIIKKEYVKHYARRAIAVVVCWLRL